MNVSGVPIDHLFSALPSTRATIDSQIIVTRARKFALRMADFDVIELRNTSDRARRLYQLRTDSERWKGLCHVFSCAGFSSRCLAATCNITRHRENASILCCDMVHRSDSHSVVILWRAMASAS
ncbi:hypothetical protein C8Q73DRAFT_528618 [Cubamyces lactineus]|nr:hypothetical protein C8Q73DRAFT_528618 [Cubamyces lactineus]